MIQIPTITTILRSLFGADMTTQWRNRRAAILSLVVPIIILVASKNVANEESGPYILAMSITIGIAASCLMGYANSLARDRDKGVFQRLRVTPAPTWVIMLSRLLVQLVMIVFVVTAAFLVAYNVDHIQLTPLAYIVTIFTSLVGASVFLGLAQLIVALIKNPETVNSTTRLVYLSLVIISILAANGVMGHIIDKCVDWSPYGTVRRVLAASMKPGGWNADITYAFLISLVYTGIFAAIGIRRFQWSGR